MGDTFRKRPKFTLLDNAICISALDHIGDVARAKISLDERLQKSPKVSLAFVKERLFYLRDPAQIKAYIEGWKKQNQKNPAILDDTIEYIPPAESQEMNSTASGKQGTVQTG